MCKLCTWAHHLRAQREVGQETCILHKRARRSRDHLSQEQCWPFLLGGLRHLLKESTFEGEMALWRLIIDDVELNVSPGSSVHCPEQPSQVGLLGFALPTWRMRSLTLQGKKPTKENKVGLRETK